MNRLYGLLGTCCFWVWAIVLVFCLSIITMYVIDEAHEKDWKNKYTELKKQNENLEKEIDIVTTGIDSLEFLNDELLGEWKSKDTMFVNRIVNRYENEVRVINRHNDSQSFLFFAGWLSKESSLSRR